jgi:indole-3-glycerol phosphate synthase
MSILDEIIRNKHKEVAERKKILPVAVLEKSTYFEAKVLSLREALMQSSKSGIIAEFKRKSPSKGVINNRVSLAQVTKGYVQAGASALSVLTDEKYFGGSNTDLIEARKFNDCPILRKDFIIDEYQVIESKSLGSDIILLIAAALTKGQIVAFSKFAKSLELEILLEIHDEKELEKITDNIDCIGINNRDLTNFKVDIERSKKLAFKISDDYIKIAESGIDSVETIRNFKTHGFKGFLMGEYFMQSAHPGKACAEFIKQLME